MLLDNIKALCKAKGISISTLEAETGIGNGTIGRWGESSPKVITLQKVADYFGCTLDEILSANESGVGDVS